MIVHRPVSLHTSVQTCLQARTQICHLRDRNVCLFLSVWNSVLSPPSSTPKAGTAALLYSAGSDWLIHSNSFFPIHYLLFFLFPLMNRLSLRHTSFPLHPTDSPSVHLHPVRSPVPFVLALSLFALRQHLLWQPWLAGRCKKKWEVEGERERSGKRERCRWTFIRSQCNPQISHHSALIRVA